MVATGRPLHKDKIMKELLECLESWRAYQRVLLRALTGANDPGNVHLYSAFKAWTIEDDRLALLLNKAINAPKPDDRDPATQLAYDLYPSSARPVDLGGGK